MNIYFVFKGDGYYPTGGWDDNIEILLDLWSNGEKNMINAEDLELIADGHPVELEDGRTAFKITNYEVGQTRWGWREEIIFRAEREDTTEDDECFGFTVEYGSGDSEIDFQDSIEGPYLVEAYEQTVIKWRKK